VRIVFARPDRLNPSSIPGPPAVNRTAAEY
jgi:hypothetical protein